jgi:PITH domain
MSRCQCNDPNHFHPGEEAGHWLFPLINIPQTSALNELRAGSAKLVFKSYEKRAIITATELLEAEDGELILVVPFTETVSSLSKTM